MGFTDALKRSLGFEEDTSLHNNHSNNYRRAPSHSNDFRMSNNATSDLGGHGYYDDVSISPEQSFYEIMLIRPKTIDDINYVVDQVLEESNPVILDLSFLEKESPANFKLAGDKIKQMRNSYGAQALLLSRCNDKNLIIISPKGVKLVRK
ncbi:cell division protein SepF [uncultured Methanobrevibacter sp.]|uniref:cell division protein SepF n=1 Tax=uncultured Methanobrevibacter sp. TaxID=253161 RepID=UPI00262CE570|nr:cell division protein SepF [uncultured Methanobrevibacter sp.]